MKNKDYLDLKVEELITVSPTRMALDIVRSIVDKSSKILKTVENEENIRIERILQHRNKKAKKN
jgi:hypothetical protein